MKRNEKFRLDLANFAKRANLNMELVVRKAALDLLRAIIGRTPVDTGRMKGSWLVQEANVPTDPGTIDKSGGEAIARGAQKIGEFKVGGRLFILSHLPYSIALEHGHSGQAPRGMVRITVREYQQYIRNAVASLPKR